MKNIRKGDISQKPNDIASAIRVSTFLSETDFRAISGYRLV